MDVTAGNRGSSKFFRGMNVLWIVLAGMFIIGICATAADYVMRDALLGHVYFGPMGFGVSGLLVLSSMATFIIARVLQLLAQARTTRRHPNA